MYCTLSCFSELILRRWVSDKRPYVTGLELDQEATLWEPNFVHSNPLSVTKEVQDFSFLRRFCNTGEGPHYIWVYALLFPEGHPTGKKRPFLILLTRLAWIQFDDTSQWVDLIPFSSLTPYSFAATLHHSVTLRAGNRKFENYQDSSPLYSSYDSGLFFQDLSGINSCETGPLNLRAVWPSKSSSFFSELPWYLRYDDRYSFSRYLSARQRFLTCSNLEPVSFNPNKFVVAVILSQDYSTTDSASDTTIPSKYTFMNDEEFLRSSLTFNGNIANSQREVDFSEAFIHL